MSINTLMLYFGQPGSERIRPLLLHSPARFPTVRAALDALRRDVSDILATSRPGNPTPVSIMDVVRYLGLLDGTAGAIAVELTALEAHHSWRLGLGDGELGVVHGVEQWLECRAPQDVSVCVYSLRYVKTQRPARLHPLRADSPAAP